MQKCAGCGKELNPKNEGVELWGSWFCSMCFIGRSQDLHRELKPEDLELLKLIGREVAGLLPPDVVEMVLVGHFKRSTGKGEAPPRAETERAIGEIQRLAAFSSFQQALRLLKGWQSIFNDFVQEQEQEIRDKVRRLTDG